MSRARSLSRLANSNAFTVDANNRVGIGTTTPVQKLNVVGVVSATSFAGDGSALTGIANTETVLSDSITVAGITTIDASGVRVTGVITATTFSGSGASLTNLPAAQLSGTAAAINGSNITNLNATQLTSGTVPDDRFPAALPAVSGANLTNLPASGDSNDITACLFI